MAAELVSIDTIPVYSGLTPEQSWATIVLADGDAVDPALAQEPLEGWANIGTWRNSSGESFQAPMNMLSDEPEGVIHGYEEDEESEDGLAEALL